MLSQEEDSTTFLAGSYRTRGNPTCRTLACFMHKVGLDLTLSQPGAASAFSKLNLLVPMIALGATLLSFEVITSASVLRWRSSALSLRRSVALTKSACKSHNILLLTLCSSVLSPDSSLAERGLHPAKEPHC